MKKIQFIIFLWVISCSNSDKKKELNPLNKDQNKGLTLCNQKVFNEAKEGGKHFFFYKKSGMLELSYFWLKNNSSCSKNIKYNNFEKEVFFRGIGNYRTIIVSAPGISEISHDAPEISPHLIGYMTFFDEKGFVNNFHCELNKYISGGVEGFGRRNTKCEDEVLLNSDGSVKEVITHPYKCTKYCGDFVPLRDNGEYLVNLDKTVLHQKPTRSSKKLAELNRNDRVKVTEDSGKIETILPHTATWAKVKTADEIEGYVFGAYIRTEDEVDYEGIKEKAKEWKKLNGKK